MGIYVVGMHRSGTSALARVVGLLVGYEGRQDTGVGNPAGHWEHPTLRYHLEAALRSVDGDWACPPLTPLAWDQIEPRFRPEIQAVIDSLGTSTWVLKDPRLCWALSAILDLRQPPPLLVSIYRGPIEVAESIATRNRYPFEFGLALWEIYTHLQLSQILASATPNLWVRYGQMLAETRSSVEAIAGWLDSKGISEAVQRVDLASASVDPALRHEGRQRASAADGRLSAAQRALADIAERACAGEDLAGTALPAITGWAQAMVELRRPFAGLEADNRTLRHRLQTLRPIYRGLDRVKLMLGRPVAQDPFLGAQRRGRDRGSQGAYRPPT